MNRVQDNIGNLFYATIRLIIKELVVWNFLGDE
jgi:hypothetical protein